MNETEYFTAWECVCGVLNVDEGTRDVLFCNGCRSDITKESQIQGRYILIAIGMDGKHRYLSTYCVHGKCTQCRLNCKTCQAQCICACYRQTQS